MPDVSIIIPNLHSPMIGETLASLERQSYQGAFEVIVVGQDRYGLVKEAEGIRHIVTPEPVGPAKARNIGIQAARGDILVFIDADCVASSDWLESLLAPYASENVSVVGGGVDFPQENFWTLCDNVATFHDYLTTNRPGERDLLPALNFSVRSRVLNEVGPFDERYPFAAEDSDLTTRLRLKGYGLNFEPHAVVSHRPLGRSSPLPLLRRAFHAGRYSVKFDPRYRKRLKTPTWLYVWWLVILLSPLLAASVLFQIIVYNRSGLRFWRTFPMVYLSKCAWCFGAAEALRHGRVFI